MTPVDFARELAAALAASLPDGFTASADDETVTIETPDGGGATTALDLDPEDVGDLEAWAEAAEGVLSLAQDVVCEALDASWPSGGAGDLPIPGAAVDGDTLRLWYGDASEPVLRLRAIVIAG